MTVHSDYNPLALMPKNSGEAMALAKSLSESSIIPEHLQKKPADCLMIVMQAHRWQMDPFIVAQCTSLVHRKLCYEGKLVAAALTSMNAIEGRLSYDITDIAGGDKQITVTGTPRGGKEQKITGTVSGWRTYEYKKDQQGRKTSEKQPNNWDKDPTSMLVYRGTRQWARLFAPEALLGVYTPDELDEQEPITVEAISTSVPQTAAAKKPAAPIEDAVVTEPAAKPKAEPAAAKPAAATQQSPASQQAASSPAATQSQQMPAAEQAPADTSGDDLPFGDPNDPANQAPPATQATQQPSDMRPGPTPESGPALSDTQMRILKSRQSAVNVSDADLKHQFPAVGRTNINDALAWLESKRPKP
jgi:hypothetical protein